jgi:hypothetical protein
MTCSCQPFSRKDTGLRGLVSGATGFCVERGNLSQFLRQPAEVVYQTL